jgi:hypothetical protein
MSILLTKQIYSNNTEPDDVQRYDLGLFSTWIYDAGFLEMIEHFALADGVSTYRIHAQNFQETIDGICSDRLSFTTLLDRASDEDEPFNTFVDCIHASSRRHSTPNGTYFINVLEHMHRASDKALMHQEALSHGIEVPLTFIVQPFSQGAEVELSITALKQLGRTFIIKPANTTGGGLGVIREAKTFNDVLEARQHHVHDKYLIQETIKPAYFDEERAWFRVFYILGEVIPCWWDDLSHRYSIITEDEMRNYALHPLLEMGKKIHEISHLDFFSTEIAYSVQRKFVAIDYANELCDMRLGSRHPDGVPDQIVSRIARRLVEFAKQQRDHIL